MPTDQAGQPYAPGAVFRICIGAITDDQDLIDRLNGIIPNVVAAENLYVQQAQATTLHNFQGHPNITGGNGTVTKKELKHLYTYRMVDDNQPGRAIYDRLKSSVSDKCPLCGVNTARTLDHHLPKAKYPILSVTPTNLVPSCRDCQSTKMTGYPQTPTDQTLHPYFDDVDNVVWLTAVVNQGTPASFSFGVTPPQGWSQNLVARVRHHMASFELPGLFADNAANELSGIRPNLTNLFHRGGAAELQAELQSRANSWRLGGQRAGRLNSWQLAMYQAAANDNWFYSQGFAQA